MLMKWVFYQQILIHETIVGSESHMRANFWQACFMIFDNFFTMMIKRLHQKFLMAIFSAVLIFMTIFWNNSADEYSKILKNSRIKSKKNFNDIQRTSNIVFKFIPLFNSKRIIFKLKSHFDKISRLKIKRNPTENSTRN